MAIQIALSLMRRVRIKALLIVLACGVSFALMRFLGALGYEMPGPLKVLGLLSFQLLLALTILIIYHTTGFVPSVGFPTRMYVLPVRTSFLVSMQMLSGALTGVATYVAVAALAWAVLGVKWPLLGPSLFLAVFLAWNMAIMWFAPGLSLAKAPPALLIWGALLVWVARRYGIDSLPIDPTKMWAHVTFGELLTLTLLGAGAFAVAAAGVRRDRRGDSFELKRFRAWLEREVVGHAHRDRDFSSPSAAQMWFEMRTKGHLIPIANVVIQLMIAVTYLCSPRDGAEAALFLAAALVVPIGCPYFVGLLVGLCSSPSEPGEMDSFRAIRPMSSTHLAHVMLKNGGLSVLLAWSGWLAVFLLTALCVHVTGQAGDFFGALTDIHEKIGSMRLVLIGLVVVLASWTAMALAASNAMGGGRWIRWVPRMAAVAIALPLIYLHARGMLSPAHYIMLFKAFCWTVGSWCFGSTILAFCRACRKRLITDRTIGFAASSWIGLCLAVGYAVSRGRGTAPADAPFPPELIPAGSLAFLLAGVLMMPFAPLAKAPLNLARSRSH